MTPVPTLDKEKPPLALAGSGGSLLLICHHPPIWTEAILCPV